MESIFETECTMACSGISNQAVCGGKNFVSIYKQGKPKHVLTFYIMTVP
jgi:hypothetical protein